MFVVVAFEEGAGYAVVPMTWFDGTQVSWHKSETFARNARPANPSWPKHLAKLASPSVYATFEEADNVLREIVSRTESSESEVELGKRQSIKRRDPEYEFSEDSDDLPDPGNKIKSGFTKRSLIKL